MQILDRLRRGVSYANVAATLAVVLGLGGTAWAAGETDVLGGPGPEVVGFAGLVQPIAGNADKFVFAGPTAQVTLDGGERLIGTASAPLGTLTPGSQAAHMSLCFQRAASRGRPAGALISFVASNFATHVVSSERDTFAVTGTTLPSFNLEPGTYNVGMCVRNKGEAPINNNSFVNGWVTVTDEA